MTMVILTWSTSVSMDLLESILTSVVNSAVLYLFQRGFHHILRLMLEINETQLSRIRATRMTNLLYCSHASEIL